MPNQPVQLYQGDLQDRTVQWVIVILQDRMVQWVIVILHDITVQITMANSNTTWHNNTMANSNTTRHNSTMANNNTTWHNNTMTNSNTTWHNSTMANSNTTWHDRTIANTIWHDGTMIHCFPSKQGVQNCATQGLSWQNIKLKCHMQCWTGSIPQCGKDFSPRDNFACRPSCTVPMAHACSHMHQQLRAVACINSCVQWHASTAACSRMHQQLRAVACLNSCVQSHASTAACSRMHQQLCAHSNSQSLAALPLSGHTEILHTPLGMGSAALAAENPR